MSITIHIPTPLRPFVDNQATIEHDSEGTVGDIIGALIRDYPGLEKNILDKENQLRKFVNIYVNDEDIRYQEGKETLVKLGATLSIIPSIAGGNT